MKLAVNIITTLRIIGSFTLLFVKSQTIAFFIIYTLCGISDIIDGYLARRFNVTSKFGEILDSIADLVFVMIMLIIFIPIVSWETWIVVWICLIIAVRLLSLAIGFIKYHELTFIHTYANKVAGLTLFLFPFVHTFANSEIAAFVLCSICFSSAVEELLIIIKNNTLNRNAKTLFTKLD